MSAHSWWLFCGLVLEELSYLLECVLKSRQKVEVCAESKYQKNTAILAPILACREEDKRYDLVRYLQENWNK